MSATPEGQAVSTRGMKNQVRIRGPKPDVCFQTKSLDAMETLLRKHIQACKSKAVPGTVYAQFLFGKEITFQIKDASDGFRHVFPHMQDAKYNNLGPGQSVPLPVTEAVNQMGDTKTKLKRQRVIGKMLVACLEKVDGFSYFEKEAWDTKHADGYRFKYLCRDSYQNKDRATNKSRKSADPAFFQPPPSHVGTPVPFPADGEQPGEVSEWFKKHGITPPAADSPARLPTYDCKGSIFVKFSASQGVVDVVYQHMSVHDSSNERAPDPIPEKTTTSSRRTSMPGLMHNGASNDDCGDPMDTSEMVSNATPQANTPIPTKELAAQSTLPTKSPKAQGKKRKRTSTKPARESLIEAESSDMDMLDVEDQQAQYDQGPPPPLVPPNFEPDPGDADFWKPSVVTIVPGVKTPAKTAAKKNFATSGKMKLESVEHMDESSASGSDFEVPGISTVKSKPQPPKSKKPTGAAAHKKNLAKAQASTTTVVTSWASNKMGEGSTASTKHAVSQTDGGTVSDSTTSRVRKQRTKTGCWTCRGRKLKCDEGRPDCGQCVRGRPRRECAYPGEGEGGEDEDGEVDLSEGPRS